MVATSTVRRDAERRGRITRNSNSPPTAAATRSAITSAMA